MTVPEIPEAPLRAAMAAAWPGLPEGVTLPEAERRTRAALAAAYPHLTEPQIDPRVQALVDLVQVLTQKYVSLATTALDRYDAPGREQLVAEVREVTGSVYSRVREIAAMAEPMPATFFVAPEAGWYRQGDGGAWELVPEGEAHELRGSEALRFRAP